MFNRQNRRSIYFFALLFLCVVGIIYVINEVQLRQQFKTHFKRQYLSITNQITQLSKVDSFMLRKGTFAIDLNQPYHQFKHFQPEAEHVAFRLKQLWSKYCGIIQRLDHLHHKYSSYLNWQWEGKNQWLLPPKEEFIRDQAKAIYERLAALKQLLHNFPIPAVDEDI